MALSPTLESKDLGLLNREFQEKLRALKKVCGERGFDLRFSTGMRGPEAQARMWCRSRSIEMLTSTVALIGKSAPNIVRLLKPEWTELGPQMTNNLPGQSWHQWCRACDIFVCLDGKAIWGGTSGKAVGELAEKLGIYHSVNTSWMARKLWHVQMYPQETPFLQRGFADSWAYVDDKMYEAFGPW